MEETIKLLIHRFALIFNLTNEPTSKEQLRQIILEQKHINFLERIKAIRTDSHFIPEYDKPKVFSDVKIMYGGEPISDATPIIYDRPISFDGDIKAWKKIIRLDHKKELKEKEIKKLQVQQRKELFDTIINPFYMKRFTETQ